MNARPMSLAEADDCCGQCVAGAPFFVRDVHAQHCENCPLLIETSEQRENDNVMRAARAM